MACGDTAAWDARGEDIDVGPARLTSALAQDGTLGPDQLADALLARLDVAGGSSDDIAPIVIRR
ncbi:hypothetical protein [Streptomyces nigra]|uniref:hypothetical protein n=1 Tax=Streptomyces nigra TaxID=1827580 RepID=UPI00343874C8